MVGFTLGISYFGFSMPLFLPELHIHMSVLLMYVIGLTSQHIIASVLTWLFTSGSAQSKIQNKDI
jgi:hypothetical protein